MSERDNHPSASHTEFPYFFSYTEGIFLTGVPVAVVPEVPFALDSSVAISERIKSVLAISERNKSSSTIR